MIKDKLLRAARLLLVLATFPLATLAQDAWDGDAVESPRDIIRRLGAESVGTRVALTLLRAGAAQKADVTVGERPAA